jgi:hypothetical protein
MGLNPEIRRVERDMRFECVDICDEETLETGEGEEDLTVPAGVETEELALL